MFLKHWRPGADSGWTHAAIGGPPINRFRDGHDGIRLQAFRGQGTEVMDPNHYGSSLDNLRAEDGSGDEKQGLAVMDGIVCQLTGSSHTIVEALGATPNAVKDPFAE